VNESDGGSNSKKKQKQQQPSNGRIRLPPPNSKQAPFEDASLKSAAPRTKPSNHSKPRAAKLAKVEIHNNWEPVLLSAWGISSLP
jgi:hypothetical protein